MLQSGFARWLQVTPISARYGLPCAIAAVALPTAIRWAIDGAVTGCEFTPYLPFVLASAIVLRWWRAALVALASVAVLGGLFVNPLHDPACFVSSAAVFLGSSAAMIATVAVVRAIFGFRHREREGASDDIVFSLEQGEVWASWYGQGPPLRLGSQQRVSRMMEDFLAQSEVGKRLNNGRD